MMFRPGRSASPGVPSATSKAGCPSGGRVRPRRKPRKRPSRKRQQPSNRQADHMTVTGVPAQTTGASRGASRSMSSIQAENRKSLMLFSGRAFPELAEEIGGVLGVKPTPMDAYDFANGEIFVRYRESVRGCDAFVVESMSSPVNKWMMESLIMVDALKRGSA